MPKKIWKSGDDVGISLDEEGKKLNLFAGPAAIEINGEDGVVVLSGTISEIHQGDKREELMLNKQAGFMNFIPSTMVTPVPSAFPRIPVAEISGMISDISKILSLRG